MYILTLTCWKFSLKYRLYDSRDLGVAASGAVERVELGGTHISLTVPGRGTYCHEQDCADHRSALELLLEIMIHPDHGLLKGVGEIVAVGHRVVHGGASFDRPVIIVRDVLAVIRELEAFAPLHNVPNSRGIESAMAILPEIPHVAVFDTAFHQTIPEYAFTYPLPFSWLEKYGIRRYGFHGPSHFHLCRRAAELLGKKRIECNLVTVHVENGMSSCAIKGGRSIDTSMGFTPLEGLVMGTRSGDIDPGIPPYIMQKLDITPQEFDAILNQKSGCSGIVGRVVSRRRLIEAAMDGDGRCRLALGLEAYRLKKYLGAYIAVAGPVDAIVFSSGIGEGEWFARQLALAGLEPMGVQIDPEANRLADGTSSESDISVSGSRVRIFVVPADEELVIAEEVRGMVLHAESLPITAEDVSVRG